MLIDHTLKVVFHALPGAAFYRFYWWSQLYVPHRPNIGVTVERSFTLTPVDQLFRLPSTLPEHIRTTYTHVLVLRDPAERLEQVLVDMIDHPEGARWINTRGLTTAEDVWSYAASHPEELLDTNGERLPWFREQLLWVEQLKGCKIQAVEYRDLSSELGRFLGALGYDSRPIGDWPVTPDNKVRSLYTRVAEQLFERDLALFGLSKTSTKHFNYSYKQQQVQPFVSVLTPTYKRPHFMALLEECLLRQTYPRDRFEWVIIDDSPKEYPDFTASSELQVRYVRLDKHTILGAKRNLSCEVATGSILIPCDDDDYMPPERIAHAVETLTQHPEAMLAYCAETPMYHMDTRQLIVAPEVQAAASFGGTWAFRKLIVTDRRYGLGKYAEEADIVDRHLPTVKLDPWKTILSFAHANNTASRDRFYKDAVTWDQPIEVYVPEDLLERYLSLKSV